jgi:hypothetical protein
MYNIHTNYGVVGNNVRVGGSLNQVSGGAVFNGVTTINGPAVFGTGSMTVNRLSVFGNGVFVGGARGCEHVETREVAIEGDLDFMDNIGVAEIRVGAGEAGRAVLTVRAQAATAEEAREMALRPHLTASALEMDGGYFSGNMLLVITLPLARRVELTSSTGDLHVEGAFADVNCTTNTGDVNLVDVVRGTVISKTGDVSVKCSALERLRVTCATGDVNVSGAAATPRITARARSSTGDVSVRAPGGAGNDVVVSCSTGDADIRLVFA